MPETLGGYIDAYADLPGVTPDLIAAYSDAAVDAPGDPVETAALLYEAARQISRTGTYDGDLLAELATIGLDDVPWFVLAVAPTWMRAMREIGLHLQHGLHALADDLHRALAAVARLWRRVMRRG